MAELKLYNMDCMDLMRQYPDKHFDLAIVDPPYGIGETWKKDKKSKFYRHSSSYKNNNIPGPDFFKEAFRVSKNQIIWGGNYYTEFLPASKCWLVWDKFRSRKTHMAEAELAWTSFQRKNTMIYKIPWNGFIVTGERFGAHPHEKPVKIYKNCLTDFATIGDNILDTHLGSMSIAIACEEMGYDLTGSEIDKDYFDAGIKRIEQYKLQQKLAL